MKKKIVLFCFFAVMTLLVLPAASTVSTNKEQPPFLENNADTQDDGAQGNLEPPLFTGYLLIKVLTYTPGMGIRPYQGANISVRGLFHSYNEQTDETGDCLIKVHTNLFRMKRYLVKVSIPPEDWLHTKRISFFMQPRQILYKEFLFVVL